MHRALFTSLTCLTFLTLAGCAGVPKVLPIGDVVQASSAGESPDRLISRVRSTKTAYALRGSDFSKLAKHGVPAPVLDELQQSFVNSVDMLARFDALGESYGGCDWCYPQPVDLAKLASGGDGMAGKTHLGSTASFARPQGVPEWVPASPHGPSSQVVTVSAVAQWARSGNSTDDLARRVRAGRFYDVIAQHPGIPGNISTHWSAGLKGSELAMLSEKGASDDTLDALQEVFLASYIDYARQHYQNWGKGQKR